MEIAGRPLIARVVETARAARTLDEVVVVTDNAAIARAAEAAGGRAVVIEREAASGTDRISQLLAIDESCGAAGIVVNIQGDEPLLEPEAIDAAVSALEAKPADIATIARALRPDEEAESPDLVKVVMGGSGRALYFSRSPVPHGAAALIHIGLYVYRRDAFDRFVASPPTALEKAERLEQLRALELGLAVQVVEFDSRSVGVDVPEDVRRVEEVLSRVASR